jgi:CO/xanthine dehydrogenase Mo-binding subunit
MSVGIHTVVQQIVSEVWGRAERVIRVEDTDRSPYDSGTGGSKSTNSVAPPHSKLPVN